MARQNHKKLAARAVLLLTLTWIFTWTLTSCGNPTAQGSASPDSGMSASATPARSGEEATETQAPGDPGTTAETSTEPETPEVPTPKAEPVETNAAPTGERTDYSVYLPNELGRTPVVMFHKFVETFEANTDKYYANTFTQLEELLKTLYEQNFRLVSMEDFLSGHIDVPAGCKPVVFTFDDGTPSQFSLVMQEGQLTVNPRSAVGIMLAFAQAHPDFGIAGSFYLNMDVNFFAGEGTKEERLRTLLQLGYDIGTHTWGHVNFTKNGTPAEIQEALGHNQQVLSDILPDVSFHSLALPYGSRPKDQTARQYLGQGAWEGIAYKYEGAFAVGSGPSVPVYHVKFDPLYVARVRATGKVAEEADLDWWLENASSSSWYVSDGNPDTLVFPIGQEEMLSRDHVADRQVIPYTP